MKRVCTARAGEPEVRDDLVLHVVANEPATANSSVNTSTISWTIAIFFGCAIVFAGIRRLTQHQGAGVTLLAQLAAAALIIAVIVLVVRRRDRE